MPFSIIVPSTLDWIDLKKVVVVKKILSIPRASLSLFLSVSFFFFLPSSVMYASTCTMDTNTNETYAHRGAPEKGAAPPSSILERSFLRSGGLKVVVASSREKRPLGLICPQFPCEASLDIVQDTYNCLERCHVASQPSLTRESAGERSA